MDISQAIDAIVAAEGALVITTPINASIKKVWKYMPDRGSALADTPCFMHGWTFGSEKRITNGLRQHFYTVNTQLFVLDADLDRAADIATQFFLQWMAAFDGKVMLGGAAAAVQNVRGGDPTLALLTWADLEYVGLDLYFDLMLQDVAAFTP